MSPSPELIPGGVPLAQIAGLTPSQVGLLGGLWVNTVQEFVGFAGHRPTSALLGAALGLGESRLENLFQEAQRLVGNRAPDARVMIADIAAADYGTGALLDEPPDEMERRQQLPLYTPEPHRSSLPPTADLLHQMPPLREQGSRSTCVPHAVLAMREQLEIAAGAPPEIDLSEQFVYWWCKEQRRLPTASPGPISQ